MNSKGTDRNLLVGILGLQIGLITETQLIDAMQKWIFQKSRFIESILEESGALNPRSREILSLLAEQHLLLHNDDPNQSLSVLDAVSKVRNSLQTLEDAELSFALSRVNLHSLSIRDKLEPETTVVPVRTSSDADRFQVLRPHAHGGLGVVSVAKDCQLHREVALKEIQAAYQNDLASRNRFLIEAEVTGRLEHPGVVPVYSLGTTSSGAPFYAMRLIRGESMNLAIAELHKSRPQFDAPAPLRELRKLIRRLIDVCNTLEYAHSRGVLHRDIKPSNIMLGRYGETLLVDWGLARAGTRDVSQTATDEPTVVPQSGDGSSETQMGTVIGTIAYMSPEQAEGRLDVISAQSDVYSLGATLYCILTGRPPVASAPQEEMLQCVRAGRIDSPVSVNKTIPKPLAAICLQALSLDRKLRYQSAASFAEDLERWLADEPISAYPEPWVVKAGRWVKRHRLFVTTAAGMLITSTVSLALVATLVRGQNHALKEAYEQIAVAQSQTAMERDAAIEQRDLSQQNLNIARALAIKMLDTAESRLSKGDATPIVLVEVRSDLTELAFENFKKLHESNPGDRQFTWEYAKTARVSGNLKRTVRDFETANERILLSLQLQNQVPPDRRTAAESDYLAETYRELGTNLKTTGKLIEASEALMRSIAISEGLQKADPENLNYVRTTALAQLEQVDIATQRHNFDKAQELATLVTSGFAKLAETETAHQLDPTFAMFGRCHQVEILLRSKKLSEASEAAKGTLALIREKLSARANDQFLPQALVSALNTSAEIALESNDDPAVAIAWLDESLVNLVTLKKSTRSAALIQREATAYCLKAEALRKQEKHSESAEASLAAKKLVQNLLNNVDIPIHNFLMFQVQLEESRLLNAEGKSSEALLRMNEALVSLTKASEQSKDCMEYRIRLQQLRSKHEPADTK